MSVSLIQLIRGLQASPSAPPVQGVTAATPSRLSYSGASPRCSLLSRAASTFPRAPLGSQSIRPPRATHRSALSPPRGPASSSMFAPIVPVAPPSCFCSAFLGRAAVCLDSSQELSRPSHVDCLQFRHVSPPDWVDSVGRGVQDMCRMIGGHR
ncbi:hypothetical protein NDU88_009710 [Pleurodeles waltl]|uniref:Uncharacterized protein n=1 Tax=Pleurodeles waltl TaxID=8319 RepID=A0AAV7QSB3_PLEWA|nr:hypothetical protein NDU88_009710 [Pleurodeles waltl]